MSVHALTWAFGLDDVSTGEKLTLLALANFADADGVCFPSQERIASDTCQGVRTVRRHLEALISRGILQKNHRQRENGSRTSDEYLLNTQPAKLAARDESNRPNSTIQPAKLAGPIEEPPLGTVTYSEPNGSGAECAELPDKQFYQEGKKLLGPKAGGFLTKLLVSQGRDIDTAMAVLREATGADDPAEYIGAVVRNGTTPDFSHVFEEVEA